MTVLVLLVVMFFLLLLKGFFSGSEIALVNCDKVKLSAKANQGDRRAKEVLDFYKTPDVMLGTTLVGTNIATVALTTLATFICVSVFGDIGEWVAMILFAPLFLLFGEIIPKSIYQQKSDQISLWVVAPLKIFSRLFYPIVFVFSRIARFFSRLIGGSVTDKTVFMTREKIRSIVEMTERTSSVDIFDRDRIRRVMRFGDTTVGEAMIPIAEVTAIDKTCTMKDAITMVRRTGYNRLPVYKGNISNIIGLLTLTTWDLMDDEMPKKKLQDHMQDARYVLPFQTIDKLLPVLRTRQDHMAVVVDEFGSGVGIITMEDIIEEVVGDIDVGYDFEEYMPRRKKIYEKLDQNTFHLDSRLAVSEVNELLCLNLNTKLTHTIGGYIMMKLGTIPNVGEVFRDQGCSFEVLDRSEKGIIKIKAKVL